LQREGVACTWEVLSGSPYAAIAEAVKPGDVIVITSRGRSGSERWLLSSVAERLVRDGPAPVIVVQVRERGKNTQSFGTAARDAALVSA
jgi:nucleotide-binding universal stress UspA family protein